MSSPRNKRGETNSAGKQRTPALRRMSLPTVRKLFWSDVHDLSYGRARCQIEVVSAINQLQYEVRSRAPCGNGQSELCYLSPAFPWRRGTFDPGGLQCSYNLFPLSYAERKVGRSKYFILQRLSSTGSSCSHARDGGSVSRRLQPCKAR